MKVSDEDAAVIKGMLLRKDKGQWIVAWFGGSFNPARIAEIKSGEKFSKVQPCLVSKLPPVGPYVSGRSAHRALIALQPVRAAIDRAIRDLTVLDEKGDGS